MKLIILAVLAVLAATRADYHDDVFHFSTLRSPVTLSYGAQLQQQQPAYRYQAYAASPAPASYYQHQHQYQPQHATYSRQYYEPAAQYLQYTPAVTQYSSGYYQHQPNVLLQAPVQTVAKTAVYQPATAVYASQVPVTTTYSSLGNLGGAHATGLSSLYARSGAASAYAPAYNGAQYRILKQVQEVDPSGPYRMHYATENGITASEEGTLVAAPEGPAVAKRGSYSYTGPDGVQYTVNWVADENGFRASGAHLPQAPEAPEVPAARTFYHPSTQYAFVNKK